MTQSSTVPASTVPAFPAPTSTVPTSTVPTSTVPASTVPASTVHTGSGTPRLYRVDRHHMFGGVVAGVTEHLGLVGRWPRVLLRLALVVLTFASGLGVVLYGAYWLVLPDRQGAPAKRPLWVQYIAGASAAVVVIWIVAETGSLNRFFVPIALAGLGGALLWRQADDAQRERWTRLSAQSLTSSVRGREGIFRLFAGATMVLIGAALVLTRNAGLDESLNALVIVVLVAVGFALITGPVWARMATELGTERRELIRAQERAEFAAHLHDSVLQTLALIQRNAEAPREVTRLARSQERELRTLLYGDRSASGTVATALREVVAEVEDMFAITVDSVIVGDAVQDERLHFLVAATREAIMNAAKHAQVSNVSLYAEVGTGTGTGTDADTDTDTDTDTVEIFVRDRGVGFDPAAVAPDRHGLRASIVERVQRHGGTVDVRSAPGAGTEIHLRMDRR